MSDSDLNSRPTTPLPEAGNDAADSEQGTPPPPAADADDDMDNLDPDDDDKDSLASELSEVDEAEFADFDPTTVALEDRPLVDIDEDAARTLKAGKRKRAEDGKKPKEAKRDKKKRRRDDDEDPDGEQIDGKRVRKPKSDGERKSREGGKERKRPTEPDDETLTPEERRRRALDKAMDDALKAPNKRRRKKDEVDLEEAFDDEIAALKIRMEQACEADNAARESGKPALQKLKMLPEVVSLLSRNTVQHSIVDPDTNFLQSVKYFLEPLGDGSLPAYNIQRDLFTALTKLPIEKEALLSSGIGKIVLFYTKSKKPEIGVKRIAERLMGEWSRPILKRSDDYKQRKVDTREYNHQAAQLAIRPSGTQASQSSSSQRPGLSKREIERERVLAQPNKSNRARMETSNSSYTVAPRSTFDPNQGLDPLSRPIGASAESEIKKLIERKRKKKSQGARRG
ncbi:Transcription factor [Lachnellula hyalina]|uniref:Transcription factor n=1 Tax=Lachnellula hyalina TaxID=1316788 RepID=A0A8H8R5X0_9HELO|nr:Transcription factor [Lachnellula hyalina]TVY28591.1 Transcription factor [Lachnellula hyalina]